MQRQLTTTDAARLLGVSVSTLKRWTLDGVIACERTTGGHRRYAVAEIETYLETQLPTQSDRREDEDLVRALIQGLPVQDVVEIFRHRQSRLGSCWAAAESFLGVLTLIGDWWRQGLVTVVQEHQASGTLERAFTRIASECHESGDQRLALLTLAEGEEHGLGLNMAEITLRECGYRVLYAGRQTPIDEIRHTLLHEPVSLVAVSASMAHVDPHSLHRQCLALESICEPARVPLLLGGSGSWPDQPARAIRLTNLKDLNQWLVRRDRVSFPLSAGSV